MECLTTTILVGHYTGIKHMICLDKVVPLVYLSTLLCKTNQNDRFISSIFLEQTNKKVLTVPASAKPPGGKINPL